MTTTEQHRAHVLTRVQAGMLSATTAATLLELSVRHVLRLLANLRKRGLAALAHGNRGRLSPRRYPERIRARVRTLARTRYAGANDHHLTDLLQEREALPLSRPTVRRILREAGIGSPRTRRPPRHRRRRDRMPQAGLLMQMDGSHHPWLQDRGPRLVLHAAIDDATGRVLGAVFRPEEDALGYFLLLRQVIRRYGLPTAAYTDRHGIFHRDPRTPLTVTEQLRGTPDSTQVGRALQELGIRWIPASSPQGKGRIERLFGTFQDRLVLELRVAHAGTQAQAQHVVDRFLPRYNARFARAPAHPAAAWRPAPARAALEQICCFKYQRTVQHDNTVHLDGRLLHIGPGQGGRSYAGVRVDVHAQLDGTLTVFHRGHRLATRQGTVSSHARSTRSAPALTPKPATVASRSAVPAADHPWRRMAEESFRRKRLRAQGVTFS